MKVGTSLIVIRNLVGAFWVIIACTLMGCSVQKEVVGVWRWDEGAGPEDLVLTFESDGSIRADMEGSSLQGTYTQEDRQLRASWPDGAHEVYHLMPDGRISIGGSYRNDEGHG